MHGFQPVAEYEFCKDGQGSGKKDKGIRGKASGILHEVVQATA